MSYSDSFNFGVTPTLQTRQGTVMGQGAIYHPTYNVVANDPAQAAKARQTASAFDNTMGVLDTYASGYAAKLKSIYDSYGQYAKDYGEKARPILDALNGDIAGMTNYIKDYGNTLAEIKDTMLNGINVDPSATRTREQYQGNVAGAYAKTAEQQKQDAESQGLNPYANTGATRAMDLARTAAMADAGNQAYSDWRTQYNKDMQAKQQGMGVYAGLQAKQAELQGGLLQGRSAQLTGEKSISDANLGAATASAGGYEQLASQVEQRRQEQLALAQQAAASASQYADLKQQQEAKLNTMDRAFGAGGGSISTDYGGNLV